MIANYLYFFYFNFSGLKAPASIRNWSLVSLSRFPHFIDCHPSISDSLTQTLASVFEGKLFNIFSNDFFCSSGLNSSQFLYTRTTSGCRTSGSQPPSCTDLLGTVNCVPSEETNVAIVGLSPVLKAAHKLKIIAANPKIQYTTLSHIFLGAGGQINFVFMRSFDNPAINKTKPINIRNAKHIPVPENATVTTARTLYYNINSVKELNFFNNNIQ